MTRDYIIAALLLAVSLQTVSPESTDTALNQLAFFELLVLEHNRDLAAMEKQIGELEDAAAEIFRLENSSVTVDGGYGYSSLYEEPHDFSGSVYLSIPILDQVSVAGGLDTDGNGSLSLSCLPLANLPADKSNDEQLALLKLNHSSFRQQLQWQSRLALLQLAAARRELQLAESFLDLRTKEYDSKLRQYEAGLTSLDDLQNAADILSSASMQVINANQGVSFSRQELIQLITKQGLVDEIPDFNISVEQLQVMIAGVEEQWQQAAATARFSSYQEQSLIINLYYLEKELAGNWFLEPNISINGSFSVADAFAEPTMGVSVNAGVSLTLSVSDFYFEEKKELEQQLADLYEDLALVRAGLKIEQQSLQTSREIAVSSADMAKRNLETAQAASDMADLNLKREIISRFEHESIILSKTDAENNYFSALISVYERLSVLLQSYWEL